MINPQDLAFSLSSVLTWMMYLVYLTQPRTAVITQVEQEAENGQTEGLSFFIASVPT